MRLKAIGKRLGKTVWDAHWQDRGREFHRRIRAASRVEALAEIARISGEAAGESVPWASAVAWFLEAKRLAKRSASYLTMIEETTTWCLPRLPATVQATTLAEVARLVEEKAKAATARTANKHWSILRAIGRWLQSQGRAGELPWLRFRALPEAPKARRALSAEEARRYIEALPPQSRLPVAFAAAAACRSGAVCALSRADISPTEITLREKGGRPRRLVRDPWLDAILGAALQRDLRGDSKGYPVFGTRAGRRWATAALLHACQRAWRRAGLDKTMTIHELCRHTLATMAGAAGYGVDALRSYLGHDSRASSARYAHRDEAVAARLRAEFAPQIVGFLSAEAPGTRDIGGAAGKSRDTCVCPACGHKFQSEKGFAGPPTP